MKIHPLDTTAILTTIVGVSALTANSVFQTQLTALFGSHAEQVLALLGLAGLIAPIILRVCGAPSVSPPLPPTQER
jgi:hypothetical protein